MAMRPILSELRRQPGCFQIAVRDSAACCGQVRPAAVPRIPSTQSQPTSRPATTRKAPCPCDTLRLWTIVPVQPSAEALSNLSLGNLHAGCHGVIQAGRGRKRLPPMTENRSASAATSVRRSPVQFSLANLSYASTNGSSAVRLSPPRSSRAIAMASIWRAIACWIGARTASFRRRGTRHERRLQTGTQLTDIAQRERNRSQRLQARSQLLLGPPSSSKATHFAVSIRQSCCHAHNKRPQGSGQFGIERRSSFSATRPLWNRAARDGPTTKSARVRALLASAKPGFDCRGCFLEPRAACIARNSAVPKRTTI